VFIVTKGHVLQVDFGVYIRSLGDDAIVVLKKLDKVLPHVDKEFITELNTIGSMHHMNLVHLCSYCSKGSPRYALFLHNNNYLLYL